MSEQAPGTSTPTPETDSGKPASSPADFQLSTLPPTPALPPGSLSEPVEFPKELARKLSKRDQVIARSLALGMSWQQACSAAGIRPGADIRQRSPSPAILVAAQYLTRETAIRCGLSKNWIVQNCVALYRRACQAEPVLGPAGWPTGQYRFDGATAARMLQMLGEDIGMFGKGKAAAGIGVDQVAALLEAVASRGRRQLGVPREAEERVVGESSAAPAAIEEQTSARKEDAGASP